MKLKVLHKGQVTDVRKILLKNRGVKNVKEFLNPNLEKVTMEAVKIDRKEVDLALKLIKKTIKEKKAIVIYGDYDVDGICGSAILWETIYSIYKNVHPYIPHRVDEGYGLSIKGIGNCIKEIENIGLVITVDNGIVASEAVDFARSLGINVIITDHHTKGAEVPNADSVIHTVELCGTGIAYLLSKKISKMEHLELVAIATIADLVPLNQYNRTLVKLGIESLKKTKRPGLLSLFEEAKLDKNKIGTYEIGHIIAPRLNAAGRISHAMESLRLICTRDKNRAKKLAFHLGKTNRERQGITIESSQKAIEKIRGELQNLIFVESKEYEQGVLGLIASKLVEEFYRPAIAVSVGEEVSKGSARSIKGVNIIELIRTSSTVLEDAGGHPMAAGFSVKTSKLTLFKKEIQGNAEKIDKDLFEKELVIDLELSFDKISYKLYEEIQKLSPFGIGNPEPVFITRGVKIAAVKSLGKEGKHLKLVLQEGGYVFSAIYFKAQNFSFNVGDLVDVVYVITQNEWNGNVSLELKIKHIRATV